ncbi:MAG TPA: UDP-4-amino-4,6-dideoxy-N-acetyl-beta-L-altrosamine transaminase [Solimonas sp.]|nr:UDP-4-amino-4,6-dideoxy-N-acetyl-beta-L-altrosamine transaminase [Solimonas sp.]
MIPYGRQDISEADIQAVVEVLRSDWLTQGPAIERFESALAQRAGAAHAVAMCNATAALHVACLALGLGPGDLLWTVPNTFVASANCGRYCGADVDFVDVDPRSYNMSAAALAEKLEQAERAGRLPKVVIPVAFAGQSADMAAIAKLRERYGFRIIEDASHAIGASYDGAPVGNGRHADITIFSFHPVKIITTGEGGAAVTSDPVLAEKLRLLRSHGITRDTARMEGDSEGGWYYQQVELGFNYRITDIQAALGASQLTRLDAFLEARHAAAGRYQQLLADLPLLLPWQDPQGRSALHLYPVQVLEGEGVPGRKTVFERLRAAGIGVNVHYIPVHLQPYYRRLGFQPGQFPEAERYYSRAISLPMYSSLTAGQQQEVAGALRAALR